ncbi:hypothetical protein DER45DRAFT_609087 [Fusarium avenaceum]|nr:hypothetical protein DER45DRAFT_609087 [Fusarium avenaceum]
MHPLKAVLVFATISVSTRPSTKCPQSTLSPVSLVDLVPEVPDFENLALRRNGDILITSVASPKLHLISSDRKYAPVVVAEVPHYTGLLGIVEMQKDLFYVVASNLTGATSSNAIWQVDLRKFVLSTHGSIVQPALTTIIAELPLARQANGLSRITSHDDSHFLFSDSMEGTVSRFNIHTGKSQIVIKDPIMKPTTSGIGVGVNGVHTLGEYLYFSSFDQGVFARVPISPIALATGPVEILARDITFGDDFALSPSGAYAYLATNGPEEVLEIDTHRKTKRVMASSPFLGRGSAVVYDSRNLSASRLFVTGGLAAGNSSLGQVAVIDIAT